jgi:hypothetical protein
MAVNKEIFGWFNFDDIYVDAINKAKNGSCFLEIGCFFGKSTEFLSLVPSVFAVDIIRNDPPSDLIDAQTCKTQQRIFPTHESDSRPRSGQATADSGSLGADHALFWCARNANWRFDRSCYSMGERRLCWAVVLGDWLIYSQKDNSMVSNTYFGPQG